MAKLTKSERDKLPESAFAWPEKRLYPVTDQDDVDSAAHLIGKAPPSVRDKVKKRILEICKSKGFKPPESWVDDAKLSAEFGHGLELSVNFDADGGVDFGDEVEREAKVLFRAGPYEFKKLGKTFDMTPEDILACCADFKPVPIGNNHRPKTAPDGHPAPPDYIQTKLGGYGTLTALTPSADFGEFGGKARVKKWLDKLHRDADGKPVPIPMSAEFDWNTKQIIGVAMTHNPRITDAALTAAFAEFAAEEAKKMDRTEHTPHGQRMMQFIHDHTAMHGAICKGENSPNVAGFTAEHELDSMQKIHDLTLGSGAACAIYKENLGKNKTWKPGQYYDTAVSMMPRYSDYRPGQYALMTAEEAAKAASTVNLTPPVLLPEKTPREKELESQLATFTAQAEADRQRLEAEKRAADAGRIAAEAHQFAMALFTDDRIVAAEFDDVIANYRRAAEDDSRQPIQATFTADDGTQKTGGRLDVYKAREWRRPKHVLTVERTPAGDGGGDDETRVALFNRESTLTADEREKAEAKRKAEGYAERRNKLNGRQPAGK